MLKNIIFFLISAVIIVILLSTFTIVETVNVGVFSANAAEIENYLNEHIADVKIEVTDLNYLLLNDPFEDTMTAIHNVLKKGHVDMLLNIEPDYLLSQKDKSIYLNLENINMEFFEPSIKKFVESVMCDGKTLYIPSSIDNTKFLLINNKILREYDIEIPTEEISMKQLLLTATEFSEKINGDIYKYPISFGSPIDEYFFDDLDKLLLEYKYPKMQIKQYSESFIEIASYAKKHSYTREEIGHSYPSDYYFSSGNVAFKIGTLYELLQFKSSNMNSKYSINNFDYSILPAPSMSDSQQTINSQFTLMCVSSITKNKTACFEVINFILSKSNALNSAIGINPTTTNVASTPLYTDYEIMRIIKERYGIGNLLYGDNFLVNSFVKNSNKHWDEIETKRTVLMDYLQNNISKSEFFLKINSIMEENYCE